MIAMSGDMRNCAMIGTNTVFHLHEGTFLIGADTLISPPLGCSAYFVSQPALLVLKQ
jgi:hypothetical protein